MEAASGSRAIKSLLLHSYEVISACAVRNGEIVVGLWSGWVVVGLCNVKVGWLLVGVVRVRLGGLCSCSGVVYVVVVVVRV